MWPEQWSDCLIYRIFFVTHWWKWASIYVYDGSEKDKSKMESNPFILLYLMLDSIYSTIGFNTILLLNENQQMFIFYVWMNPEGRWRFSPGHLTHRITPLIPIIRQIWLTKAFHWVKSPERNINTHRLLLIDVFDLITLLLEV